MEPFDQKCLDYDNGIRMCFIAVNDGDTVCYYKVDSKICGDNFFCKMLVVFNIYIPTLQPNIHNSWYQFTCPKYYSFNLL